MSPATTSTSRPKKNRATVCPGIYTHGTTWYAYKEPKTRNQLLEIEYAWIKHQEHLERKRKAKEEKLAKEAAEAAAAAESDEERHVFPPREEETVNAGDEP